MALSFGGVLDRFGFAFVAWTSPAWTEFVVGCVFFSLLLVLAFIDLDHRSAQRPYSTRVVLGFAFSVLGWTGSVLDSVLGAVVGFGLITLIAVISRGGMGMGDAKLMAMIGAFSGWKAVFYVLFGASLLGSIGGIIYLYVTKQDRKTPIPFGPSLAVAAIVMYFFLK